MEKGSHHKKESIAQMSEKKKGNNYSLGHTMSVEGKIRLSHLRKGKLSEETRRKMSEAGKKKWQETPM